MKFSHVFLQIKVPTETFATCVARERLLVVVCMHMKCEVVHLMERLAADVTLEGLHARVCQAMVLVVAFLVKALATDIANKRFIAGVYSHVCIQRR